MKPCPVHAVGMRLVPRIYDSAHARSFSSGQIADKVRSSGNLVVGRIGCAFVANFSFSPENSRDKHAHTCQVLEPARRCPNVASSQNTKGGKYPVKKISGD